MPADARHFSLVTGAQARLRLLRTVWVVLILFTFPAGALFAAPKAELWERWTVHNESATASIDHNAWTEFLSAYVEEFPDGVNRVGYAEVTADDRERLERYLAALTGIEISRYSRTEQRAYWINLYNALTVKLVLDYYPVDSIRDIDISPGFFSIGPWDKKLVNVEGEALSLNDIEHRILRPIWKDPRIHYAVNCASIGCPNLMSTAFTADNTELLLERGAREYVNHPRGVEIVNGKPVASKIYDWFQSDFGDSDRGVLAHLSSYAEPALQKKLSEFTRLGGYRYDWALNGATEN